MNKIYSISIIVSIFFLGYIFFIHKNNNFLEFSFLSVGQGDATYIKLPSGLDILIDVGPLNNIDKELSKLTSLFDSTIDIVFITHTDADHHGGLSVVSRNYNVRNLFLAEIVEEDKIIEIFSKENKYINIQKISGGSRIYLDEEIYIDVLSPVPGGLYKDNNDKSLVLRFVYREISVLFTGDASKDVESDLINRYIIKSEILKIGHHGSNTSSDISFIEKVNPSIAIISAGKDNKYGHPSSETMQTLDILKIEYWQTKDGALTLYTDGYKYWRKKKHPTRDVFLST